MCMQQGYGLCYLFQIKDVYHDSRIKRIVTSGKEQHFKGDMQVQQVQLSGGQDVGTTQTVAVLKASCTYSGRCQDSNACKLKLVCVQVPKRQGFDDEDYDHNN